MIGLQRSKPARRHLPADASLWLQSRQVLAGFASVLGFRGLRASTGGSLPPPGPPLAIFPVRGGTKPARLFRPWHAPSVLCSVLCCEAPVRASLSLRYGSY